MLHWLFRKKIVNPPGIPDYHLGPIYDTSGAQRMVMQQEFRTPVVLVRGAGMYAGWLRVLQPPQVYVSGQLHPTTGLGGLQAGARVTAPLEEG